MIVPSKGDSHVHIVIALGVSKMGLVAPLLIPEVLWLDGARRGGTFENQFFPAATLAVRGAGI